MAVVRITYFSDILCIWAYVAQARVDALKAAFGTEVEVDYRFCSVFGDTQTKIGAGWKGRGEFAGYNGHVRDIARRFSHIQVQPEVWISSQPASSASPHLFLAATQAWERKSGSSETPIFESVMWAFRRGFFLDGLNIANWDIQCQLARPFGVDVDAVEEQVRSGNAFAKLSADYHDAQKTLIEGSPTFVLNDGRQKLYGNVGFRIIEASVKELLREPHPDQASWC